MNESEQIRAIRVGLADQLRARQAEIAQVVHAHIQAAVPDTMGTRGPAYEAGLLRTVSAVLSYSLEAITQAPRSPGPIPEEAKAQGRRAARAGVGLGAVLCRYVAGHRRFAEFVAEEMECGGLSSDVLTLRDVSRTLEALLGYLITAIEHEYERECRRVERSPDGRRMKLVQGLLVGDVFGRGELALFGYDFDAWHVGLIAVGERARDMARRLEMDHRLLYVFPDDEMVWAWLGWRSRPSNAEMARLQSDWESVGVGLAVGEPAQGVEGWRLTHQQAQRVMQVVLLGPQAQVRYADVALLAPWLQDLESAYSLIEIYLSPLVAQKDGGVAGLKALSAYFEAGRNAKVAAAKLGIDRRTLAYRLRNIEEYLGYQLESRLAELEVAVRLRGLLSGPDWPSGEKLDVHISTLA